MFHMYVAAFPDLRMEVEDVVASADKAVARVHATGTHHGEFMGMPATHRDYTISGIDIHRLEGGRMAEHWHVVDQLSQLQQLGVLPAPASS
jgi:steroid delta-isomerase-like uncharacterized protein